MRYRCRITGESYEKAIPTTSLSGGIVVVDTRSIAQTNAIYLCYLLAKEAQQ